MDFELDTEFYVYVSVHRWSMLIITNSEVNSVRKHNYNCMLDHDIY